MLLFDQVSRKLKVKVTATLTALETQSNDHLQTQLVQPLKTRYHRK